MNYSSEMNSLTCQYSKEEEPIKNHNHVIVAIVNRKMTPPNKLNKKVKKWRSKKLKLKIKTKFKLKKLKPMFQLKMKKKKKYNKLKAMKAKPVLFKTLE